MINPETAPIAEVEAEIQRLQAMNSGYPSQETDRLEYLLTIRKMKEAGLTKEVAVMEKKRQRDMKLINRYAATGIMMRNMSHGIGTSIV